MQPAKGCLGARGASFRMALMGCMPHRPRVIDAPFAADLSVMRTFKHPRGGDVILILGLIFLLGAPAAEASDVPVPPEAAALFRVTDVVVACRQTEPTPSTYGVHFGDCPDA